jgi:hypothetical protein
MNTIANPKYPNITIALVGEDGNAFSILGRVKRQMRRSGLPEEEFWAFHAEATASDYDNLLVTVMRWFSTNAEWDTE